MTTSRYRYLDDSHEYIKSIPLLFIIKSMMIVNIIYLCCIYDYHQVDIDSDVFMNIIKSIDLMIFMTTASIDTSDVVMNISRGIDLMIVINISRVST